jgi:hypothetical protein
MRSLSLIRSFLTSLVEPKTQRRRDRVQYMPSAEQMEPRALQSGFKVSLTTLVPGPRDAGAMVISVNRNNVQNDINSPLIVVNYSKDQINVEN